MDYQNHSQIGSVIRRRELKLIARKSTIRQWQSVKSYKQKQMQTVQILIVQTKEVYQINIHTIVSIA
jgi:hypothetical protein